MVKAASKSVHGPLLAITLGDINGIGPEILVKALADQALRGVFRPVVIGSAPLLESLRYLASGCPPFRPIEDFRECLQITEEIPVFDGGIEAPNRAPGRLDAAAGRCAVEWLKIAVRGALDGIVDGLVTCPLNKEGIHLAGYPQAGHTDIIAEMTNSRDYRMCLFSDRMRIVHISAHLPLAEAVKLVRADRIAKSVYIGHQALIQLGMARRRIAVAGLNPHAGEAGALGVEDFAEIAPAVSACRAEGIDCTGPYPPDTVFRRMWEGEFDMVVAMYHDQGHIALKLVAMDEGVNVTLGVPIIRTSVDHGTAYDLAGKGTARAGSLCAALRLAAEFARSK